jgi:RNA polymerase sigma factor (sigma-70 family)
MTSSASHAFAKDGDEFEAWVEPHLVRMANLAARLAPSVDRDDVVQAALARAWTKRTAYDPKRGAVSAWLLAITADQARQALRRHRSTSVLREIPSPYIDLDQRLDIEAAVVQLSPRQRLAVNCYYFAGLSVDETAAVMHCSDGTVKSTLADARTRLRELLGVDLGYR